MGHGKSLLKVICEPRDFRVHLVEGIGLIFHFHRLRTVRNQSSEPLDAYLNYCPRHRRRTFHRRDPAFIFPIFARSLPRSTTCRNSVCCVLTAHTAPESLSGSFPLLSRENRSSHHPSTAFPESFGGSPYRPHTKSQYYSSPPSIRSACSACCISCWELSE